MLLIDSSSAKGDVIHLAQTHANHLDSGGQKRGFTVGEDRENFGNLMAAAIGRVSNRQLEAENLFVRMITNPDEVEPHDVTIAMAQANMGLNLTKTILDRAVKAYSDITAMR